jgi:hypothetical protein
MFVIVLLRECVHSCALAGAQGGVHGGRCQAEGREGSSIFILVVFVFVIVIISITGVVAMTQFFCIFSILDFI